MRIQHVFAHEFGVWDFSSINDLQHPAWPQDSFSQFVGIVLNEKSVRTIRLDVVTPNVCVFLAHHVSSGKPNRYCVEPLARQESINQSRVVADIAFDQGTARRKRDGNRASLK